MTGQEHEVVHEVEKGIGIVTILASKVVDAEQVGRIEERIDDLLDSGVDRLILDCRNVHYITSEFIGFLIVLRKRLSATKPFQHPRRGQWRFFQFCPDRETALNVISHAESDPLVFCCAAPEVRDIFAVCSLGGGG